MFSFIKEKLHKIYTGFTSKLSTFFGRTTIDEATLHELELLLIASDTGVNTTRAIINQVKHAKPAEGAALRSVLEPVLISILQKAGTYEAAVSPVYLLVGINGSGKTTSIGKLAHQLRTQGKKTLLVAADTFRAAAPEQLTSWANSIGVDIVLGTTNQDPAAVVFNGCERFKKEGYDALIIDTAGRLHTKVNLMNELAKIKRVISKQLPDTPVSTLLTIDAMLGQNSFEQAKLFKECTQVNGIILTKMDGTGKGGIVFAIADQLQIPIAYITFGEQVDHIKPFNPESFVHDLVGG
jgi:fused signal recognition particle receptor